MRCRICGAKLKKDGDICINCYKKYQEEEDLKKDNNPRLEITRVFLPSYIGLKYTWIIVIFALAAIGSFAYSGILASVLTILALLLIFVGIFFCDKKMSEASKVVLYDKHMTYTCKWWFINKEKTVKYSDLYDATYFQSFSQKRNNIGDLCVYAKGSFPGNSIFNGFQIKNIEDPENVIREMSDVIGKLEN